MSDETAQRIARMVEEAPPIGDEGADAEGVWGDFDPQDGPPPDDAGAGGDGGAGADPKVVERCAGLDHSDTDNATRLVAHFGQDLAVLAQDEVEAGAFMAWCGTHWDLAGGLALAKLIAQRLGPRIALETAYILPTARERDEIAAGAALAAKAEGELTSEDRRAIAQGEHAAKMVEKRKSRRWAWAVSSKNKARMDAALACVGPRLRRAPDAFNLDKRRIASLTHTLDFAMVPDLESPDPDAPPRLVPTCVAIEGHRREDFITAVVPQPYREGAEAPRWRDFLARMLPDAEKRRTVQQFTGLGLLAVPVQNLMFHYGLGANGKSVFLEVISRVLGPSLAVSLPRESIVGGSERNSGGPSPDIARLYGKRFVRIVEVPGDVPLQEDLIKRLTGGEAMSVRTLFKGYFEFQNCATAHMSGNGKPSIGGTDHGIWRRILVVFWDQTIPVAEQGDFEEVVSRFVREEGPGILQWLIEGVLDWMAHGLVVAPSVRMDTAEYREEQDPVGEFLAACVNDAPATARVGAGGMYQSYGNWSLANGKRAVSQTRFGRRLKQRFHSVVIAGRIFYEGCELHDVPPAPDAP